MKKVLTTVVFRGRLVLFPRAGPGKKGIPAKAGMPMKKACP